MPQSREALIPPAGGSFAAEEETAVFSCRLVADADAVDPADDGAGETRGSGTGETGLSVVRAGSGEAVVRAGSGETALRERPVGALAAKPPS